MSVTVKIILVIIFVVLIVAVIGYTYLFCFSVLRRKQKKSSIGSMNLSRIKRKYADEINSGIEWFQSQEKEMVYIKARDGLKLAGYLLEAENARGTMILVHGYRSAGHVDFSAALRIYHELGYNLLTVCQRAHGKSEGMRICYGYRERYDCQRWAEYVRDRFGPDKSIFLGGMSMGATTVLMTSSLELPENVDGIIADCGFTSCHDIFENICHVDYKLFNKTIINVFLGGLGMFMRLFGGFSMKEYSTEEAMKECRIPVLFIHGEDDKFVPSWMSEKNYEACASEKELILVPGASHGVSFLVDMPRCSTAVTEFLKRNTR